MTKLLCPGHSVANENVVELIVVLKSLMFANIIWMCEILGIRCGAVEVFALVGCCTVLVGSLLLTFWDDVSVLSSRV